MFFSKLRTAILAAALCVAPGLSVAQDVIGTITASLDGAERTWVLTLDGEESQSFGLTIGAANLQSYSLWGLPDAQSGPSIEDTLLFTFDIMTVGDQVMPVNASVIYLAEGWTSGWSADEPETVTFSLTTLEKTEAGVVMAGSFDAATKYSKPLAGGEVDPARPMQITGTFSATMPAFMIEEK